jgi:hypothetical protein
MSGLLSIVLLSFSVFFWIIEKSGLFSSSKASNIEILHSMPFIVSVSVMLSILFVFVIKKGLLRKYMLIVVGISIALMVSGLWTSYFTRFSAEAVITEGQSVRFEHIVGTEGSIYRRKYSRAPGFDIILEKLVPIFGDDKRSLRSLMGDLTVLTKNKSDSRKLVLTSGSFRWTDGYILRINDFGYSPRYILRQMNRKILDSSFVYMDLFPPGREDYFRLLSPITYYLSYDPDMKKIENSLIRVRIARNKDIIARQQVKLNEEVRFDNGIISFPEVRMWTKISVTRDIGIVIFISGFFLGSIILIIKLWNMKWKR